MDAWIVFLATFITAIATALGAAPFLFVKGISRRWRGVSNAIAGMMLAASHGLLVEGSMDDARQTIFGLFAKPTFPATCAAGAVAAGSDV
jgi:zinc transporter, ZIP family